MRKRVIHALVATGLLAGMLPGVAAADGHVDVIEDVPTVVAVVDEATTPDFPVASLSRADCDVVVRVEAEDGSSQEWMSCTLSDEPPDRSRGKRARPRRPPSPMPAANASGLPTTGPRRTAPRSRPPPSRAPCCRAVRSWPGPPIQPNPWTAQRRSSATRWMRSSASPVPAEGPFRRPVPLWGGPLSWSRQRPTRPRPAHDPTRV